MQENLGELKLDVLMEKLGAGSHKPGAGSAAALQGMISAKLLKTVIELTKDRDSYKNIRQDLEELEIEVEKTIYPRLHSLMQVDAEQFDKVIKLRNARDKQNDIKIRSRLAKESLEAQTIAIEIPLEIAKRCIRLANIALFVFDKGFKSARGDSSVAINCAISSIGGCLSIIDLNLLSFITNEWTERVQEEADLIKREHANLLLESVQRQDVLNSEAAEISAFYSEINKLRKENEHNPNLSDSEIETVARTFQNILYKYRELIWKKALPQTTLDILKAEKALRKLGYQYSEETNLGYHNLQGDRFEVAGIIDSQNKYVSISKKFAPEVRNFTTAHELGHAIFHPGSLLHRDRPLDRALALNTKDWKERQADKFATYFLMPANQVLDFFQHYFGTKKFEVNTYTAVALGWKLSVLRKQTYDRRGLARIVASATIYDGKTFKSLAQEFKVSVEAMAIRLEELNLV
jgi:formiminotetrahydrofolate cyclodeaminase/Zn-dependent peptidase ImmA (M78 family)